jgi:LacI family transcriptional regulator
MRAVADRAQVAMSSVSRVLSQHPDVSAAMRERVLAAVEELGYRPDMLAQGLRRGATYSVGFLVGDVTNPLLAAIVKGAESELRDRGYSVLLANSERDVSIEREHLQLFAQRRVDGLILSLATEDDPETLEVLRDIEAPSVMLDRDVPGAPDASLVLTDHRVGMRDAVGHLLDLGHRRIGLVTGAELRPTRERIAGAREAYAARRLPDGLSVMPGDFTSDHGARSADELLDAAEPPTALVAGGNQILIGILRALQRRGLAFPSDVSLVTCDDTEITTVLQPPISAVSRDYPEVGTTAARLLLRRLGGRDAGPETITLPTRFLARASCAPPRG